MEYVVEDYSYAFKERETYQANDKDDKAKFMRLLTA